MTDDILQKDVVFLVVSHDISATNISKQSEINVLSDSLEALGISTIGLSASLYELTDQFRHDYFSDPDAAGRKSINKICQDQDINLINPYCDPDVFKLFIGKSWDELMLWMATARILIVKINCKLLFLHKITVIMALTENVE